MRLERTFNEVLELTLKDDWGIGSNEHSTRASATDWTGATLSINGNIPSKYNRIAAVPRTRFDPVDGVEKGSGGAIACVLRVDALNVVVARLAKEVHEDRLDRLGLVDNGLGADVDATNGLGVDIVLFKQRRDG